MKVLVIDGVIGESYGGVTAKQFRQMLPTSEENIKVLINSPGGSVVDGFDIFNQLVMYKGSVEIVIGAMAASAASYIAMAAPKEKRKGFANSGFMIHESRGTVSARARDLRILSDRLEGINNVIAQEIAKGTGNEFKKVRKDMTEDFYLTGWEELLAYNVISDTVDKEYFAQDEFIYPQDGSVFDWLMFGKALEQSAEARKETVFAIDGANMQNEMAQIAALDLSVYEAKESTVKENSPTPVVENINKGEPKKMATLQEFLAVTPEAKAEYEAALASAMEKGMTQANENTAQILALEGVKLSASATEALDTGIDPKTYAFNKLKAEQEKRETVEAKKPIFASLVTAQTPGEQADKIVKTDAQIKAEMDEFEKGIAAAAEKTLGGKK